MTPPLFSVLMVTYNFSLYVKDAIESVLNQSYTNWELIIVDDNSIDDTWNKINSFTDSRIKRERNEQNLGEYSNRNKAISLVKGQYAIFLDGEDLLYPHAFAYLADLVNKYPECGMLIAREWDERIIYPVKIDPSSFFKFELLDRGITALNFTRLIFKSSVIKSNLFDRLDIKMGDIYIQYKIASSYDSLIIAEGFSWWRRRKNQASEKLLNNNVLYSLDLMKIKLAFGNGLKLLSAQEKKVALSNMRGPYFRLLLKQLIKLKFSFAKSLNKVCPFTFADIARMATYPKRDYFIFYTGENPLKNIRR